jgi:hypothetical protein
MDAHQFCEIVSRGDERVRRQCLQNYRAPGRFGQESESEKPFDEVAFIMQYEQGDLTDDQVVNGFQHLVDSGVVWQLQGHYGRTAHALINEGLVHLPQRGAGAGQEPIPVIEIRQANVRAGKSFFGPNEMRFFRSRIETPAYRVGDIAYFVTSERGPDMVRRYSVRSENLKTGNVEEVSGFQHYASRSGAMKGLERVAGVQPRMSQEMAMASPLHFCSLVSEFATHKKDAAQACQRALATDSLTLQIRTDMDGIEYWTTTTDEEYHLETAETGIAVTMRHLADLLDSIQGDEMDEEGASFPNFE